ncbi:sugar-binding transcriptional regulator [Brachybacterium saurashtrense]|uniref:MarR family transcriptional regulator n=1 Tax=Brachybacterium saurashtrense TaxID=556288 RepID=A0A345YSR4_9MICO|nr:sugar-binding domain-containing protein [Brachybacterium saurashtrense]AXK46966.1 MarR family transcriptional regulator [Brachybacterium saurashtrense]RRR22681.1 MarR family transcriptional regulator [Brachybacterium saurashtrense]
MPAPRDTAVVVRAARLYYEQGRSQTEIAHELDLSRSNVSRILSQAKERGIVEITIHDPDGPPRRDEALEAALRAAFSLREAHVVSAPRAPAMESVAREGAAVLAQRVATVRSIGVSWGQTVQSVVAELETLRPRPTPAVLPLVGGHSTLDQFDSGESVLRVLASRLGATPRTLYAPAVLESATAVATLRGESSIGEVLAAAAQVELALVGIGSLGRHSSPLVLGLMRLSEAERAAFAAQNPVGDVCGRFVDADGVPLGAPTDQRVLALTFSQLLRIPEVVGVAAGPEKAPGVLGVLRSGVIDTVVVDVDLAREVLART